MLARAAAAIIILLIGCASHPNKRLVDAVGEGHAIIDVGGVGYEVQASARTLRALQIGDSVSLAIETHVREDAIRLFGFTSEVERSWFRTLQTIQGVGSKVALAVLGTLSPQDLANAIALQNWAAVEQSPGVGKKLAQRIVAELKDKAPALSVAGLAMPAQAMKGGDDSPARAAAAEARVNTASPMARTRRRPNRSPSAAAVSRNTANASVYALTVHSRPANPVSSSRRITGSALVTTRLSMVTMKTATPVTRKVQRRLMTAPEGISDWPLTSAGTRRRAPGTSEIRV